MVREAKRFLKQQLKGGGGGGGGGGAPPAAPPEPPYEGPIDPIDEDSYFRLNAEYAAWLREARGVHFRRAPAAWVLLARVGCW